MGSQASASSPRAVVLRAAGDEDPGAQPGHGRECGLGGEAAVEHRLDQFLVERDDLGAAQVDEQGVALERIVGLGSSPRNVPIASRLLRGDTSTSAFCVPTARAALHKEEEFVDVFIVAEIDHLQRLVLGREEAAWSRRRRRSPGFGGQIAMAPRVVPAHQEDERHPASRRLLQLQHCRHGHVAAEAHYPVPPWELDDLPKALALAIDDPALRRQVIEMIGAGEDVFKHVAPLPTPSRRLPIC
jgi:hypothetical protein